MKEERLTKTFDKKEISIMEQDAANAINFETAENFEEVIDLINEKINEKFSKVSYFSFYDDSTIYHNTISVDFIDENQLYYINARSELLPVINARFELVRVKLVNTSITFAKY